MFNYAEYASTHPIDCTRELLRLPNADYDACCALLTMLLREDHLSNGSFARRQCAGQVKSIIDRMITMLEIKNKPSIKLFSEKTKIKLHVFLVTLGIIEDIACYSGKSFGVWRI